MTLADINLSPTGGPDRHEAVGQRSRLCAALGLPFQKLTVARQVHGGEVLPVEPDMVGCGRDSADDAVAHVDGLCTNLPNQPLLAISADCPLILLFDPDAPAIGVCHAGWRGTLAGIARRLVEQMRTSFAARPNRIWGTVSPSAGPCCFEVRRDVERLVRARWSDADRYLRRRGDRSDRTYLDLWKANLDQLTACGVPAEHMDLPGLCSICDVRFCSYRRNGIATRFAGLIAGLI